MSTISDENHLKFDEIRPKSEFLNNESMPDHPLEHAQEPPLRVGVLCQDDGGAGVDGVQYLVVGHLARQPDVGPGPAEHGASGSGARRNCGDGRF